MIAPETFNELVAHRRSIFPKDYTAQPVEDAVVRQILENATWAPTHKLTEPWHFVVFSGSGLKKLADFQAECYRQVTQANNTFKDERYHNLLTKPMQSSHIIAVGMKRDPKGSVPETEELGAVFCAVQNMYLTATAYGLGAYLSTGGITYFEEAKSFFGLEKFDRLIGFFHIGKTEKQPSTGRRKSVDEKTTWVSD